MLTSNGTAILETTINENSTEVAITNAGYKAKKMMLVKNSVNSLKTLKIDFWS